MLSATLARHLGARHIHYGWAVLAATFLTMLVVAGAVGAPGVFIAPLQKEYGWSAADISGALAIRFLLFGGMGPFAAAFMNRFGVRRMMLISLSIIVSGLLLSLGMSQLWQLVLLWGVVIGSGTGLTAMVLGATVATRWFSHRRGMVMGLLSASTATGQLAFLPLLASLTEHLGWRASVLLMCGAIVLAAMVVLLLMRDRPSDLGLPPYGDSEVHPAPPQPASFGALLMTPIRTLAEASRVPSFWILFFSFFICGASTNGLVQTHFIPMCGDYGLAAVGAASMLAMMGLFDFAGTLASGWLSDRFDNRWLLFWYYGLRGLSLLYLPFSDFSLYSLSIFAIFYGLDWVATVPPTVKLTAQRFGPERANIVFGWIFAGHQLGAASAALAGGLSRTIWQSYMPAFVAAGILCLIGAGLVLLINRGRGKTFALA
ncbi:major facilitator superfamily MFS_1 [Sphingobium chlorophenolicum L-1]|uniref:Major facilitator superfamily MFS_1 n=1 Tax=Sphingobium chlorophenolicum L-1 TaxID=690566 RepID=F6F3W2_SPHCR|nr:MFS transporter [Sphingobium chlorophenolicum]AEG51124.1 major facilitator superfamily MFS_1 [Sphingobium chlorophenolicum L-1]